MVTLTLIKSCLETSSVYFWFIIVVFATYGNIINNTFFGKSTIHWVVCFLLAIKVFRIFCGVFCKNVLLCPFILVLMLGMQENVWEFMFFWKMLFNYLQEELTNFCFDKLTTKSVEL